jgi:Zn finger protein HypA/HybF involved in hydrogenase expression
MSPCGAEYARRLRCALEQRGIAPLAENQALVPLEFRCSKCGQVKDVRTLRASVCPDCTAGAERDAEIAADAGLMARKQYEAALARGPHYTGALENWTPKDPVLLADGEHFVCPNCKRERHLVHDLAYRWQKKQFPIPTKYTPCDECHRKETDDTELARPRSRFSRDR